jgi:hypothetical protein
MLNLPPQGVVDRGKPCPTITIPDPEFSFGKGDVVFEVVYGCLTQDPQYYALSPRMRRPAGR